MVEMAELNVTREGRRLYWAGVGNALGSEWENPATFHRQSWQEEERLADKKYAEVAGQIMLAERGYPVPGALQVSDIGLREPQLGSPFDDKKANRWPNGGQPCHSYAKPMETVAWTEEKKSIAVDKWMEDMGAAAPHARVESLFIGNSDSSDGAMSPKRVEDWIDQGAIGNGIGPQHSIETDSFLSERYRAKLQAPQYDIVSLVDDDVRRIWTKEDEAVYEEAEVEREKQRLEANALSDRIAADTADAAIFEEAEAEREEQRLHASSGMDTESNKAVLIATTSCSTSQGAAHSSESRHELGTASTPNNTKPNVGMDDESLPGCHVEPHLTPCTETHMIERSNSSDFVADRHTAGPTSILPTGYIHNAKAPSSIPPENEPEGTQAGRDMFAALLEELDKSDSSDSQLDPEIKSMQQPFKAPSTQPSTLLAEQQALAMAAFRGLQKQGLIAVSGAANKPEAPGVDSRLNNAMRNEVVPLVRDPVTDLELQTSRFEGMTVATEGTSRASTEFVSEQVEWMDIDNIAVEVVNLQDAADSDPEYHSSDYTIPEFAEDAMELSRPRTRLIGVQPVQESSTSVSGSKMADSGTLDSGSNDDGDPCDSESGSDNTIGYEREPEVRHRKRSTSAFERRKSASAMSKQRHLSKIWKLENKLRKIRKYRARRDAGKEIPFAHTRMINREEDFAFDLEDLRAWENGG